VDIKTNSCKFDFEMNLELAIRSFMMKTLFPFIIAPNNLLAALLFALAFWPSDISAKSRLNEIKERAEIRVCIWPGYYAISYRDPRTSELEGIDIDMARELASELGVKLSFIDSSFASLVKNITTDACDIAMHGVGVRESRKAHMDFSDPHLASGIYAVSTKSNSIIRKWEDIDQDGVIAVVQKGTYMEPVMRKYLKKAKLSVVNSFKAREQEVQSGRADVFLTDFPYGRRMAKLTNWARLLAPKKVLAPTPYAYAVPKGDAEWLARINAFVASIKRDGRLARSAARHGLTPIVAK
jgi:ABC-type amino acid transport substrate-binding protein